MHPAIQGLLTIAFGVGGCVGYFYLSNIILDTFIFPARGNDIAKNIRRANMVRPWLFLAKAMARKAGSSLAEKESPEVEADHLDRAGTTGMRP